MAALTWGVLAFDNERPPDWSSALMGIQFFIRPELAILSIIFAIYLVVKRPVGWWKELSIVIITFTILALLLFIISGSFIPDTMSAKMYFFAEGCLPNSFKSAFVMSALWMFIKSLGLFSVGFVLAGLSKQRLVLFSFVVLFLYAYFQKFPGALFHNDFRYLYLLLPIAVFGWAAGLNHVKKAIRYSSIILGVLAAISVLYYFNYSFRPHIEMVKNMSRIYSETAQWVSENVPKNAIVMVHDDGKISMLGKQHLVDMVGLKYKYSINLHRNTTFRECRRMPVTISDIARHAGASYMVVINDWDNRFGLTESLRLMGWTLERVDAERGNSLYKVYKIIDNTKASTPEMNITK